MSEVMDFTAWNAMADGCSCRVAQYCTMYLPPPRVGSDDRYEFCHYLTCPKYGGPRV